MLYEIKEGINGSGKAVFSIYWANGNIDGLTRPFKSYAEADCNATHTVKDTIHPNYNSDK